jgi:hypothetical protein
MKRWMVIGLTGVAGLSALLVPGANSQEGGFRVVKLPGTGERITGMYCQSAKACVISTSETSLGRLYATDGQKITATLMVGNSDLAEKMGTLGEIGFLGFSKVGDRLVAHVRNAGGAFISARGDITKPASWSAVKLGGSDTQSGGFGLNHQMGFAARDGRWVYMLASYVMETTDDPGPGALWTTTWSPYGGNPVPRDIAAQRRADPTLCDSDPKAGFTPQHTQTGYIAPDLSLMMYPASSRNQGGTDAAGVCISTDGGRSFRLSAFKDVKKGLGPVGVTCVSKTRCLAYNGLDFEDTSAYIFVTNDAQNGAKSTWTRAALPTLRKNTNLRSVFFAPDGTNGWAVGWSDGAAPLLLSTADGGQNWKDASSSVRALIGTGSVSSRLHSGYAFSANHVWIGGERDTLLTIGN